MRRCTIYRKARRKSITSAHVSVSKATARRFITSKTGTAKMPWLAFQWREWLSVIPVEKKAVAMGTQSLEEFVFCWWLFFTVLFQVGGHKQCDKSQERVYDRIRRRYRQSWISVSGCGKCEKCVAFLRFAAHVLQAIRNGRKQWTNGEKFADYSEVAFWCELKLTLLFLVYFLFYFFMECVRVVHRLKDFFMRIPTVCNKCHLLFK